MNTNEVREICRQRLAGWTKKLVGEHATPVLLLGVGHDNHSGKLVLCITEDMPLDQLEVFLAGALAEIRRKPSEN